MFNISPFTLAARAIVLLTAIPVHESAHAYVANKLGDPTAKNQGRISLNPIAHLEPIGFLSLILFGIGWAKPVPINRYNFDDRKKGMALSAAAGPISNLVIALISMILAKIFFYTYSVAYIIYFSKAVYICYNIFSIMCTINISLAIFNLLPFPPFDGSRIFNYFLSDKYYFKIMEYERYIFIGIIVLLYTGVLDGPLSFLNGVVYSALNNATFFIDLLFKTIR